MALVALTTLLGAALQSAVGFGFALVLAPVLFAALEPDEAVTTLLGLGVALNLLVLFAESRTRQVRERELALLVLWALPGLATGALVLALLSRPMLQVTVGVLVVLAAAVQARSWSPQALGSAAPRPSLRAGAGLATGVLTTTTGTNGPPLVLWLERIGASPAELRDTLAAAFLALNLLGAVALLAPGGADLGIDAPGLALLLVLTIAGQRLGRIAFVRLDPARFRTIALGLVVLTGLASIAAGLAG